MTNNTELESANTSEHEASAEVRTGEQVISKSIDDIDDVESRITAVLGIQPGSAEAIKLTDEALVDIANYELSSDEFTAEERRDVVEDVVIESAIEMAHGAMPNQTALSIFNVPKNSDSISDVVQRLNKTHATLPSGHEAGLLVEKAMKDLTEHPVMQETPGTVEYITSNEAKTEQEKTIDAAVERAERAAEAGIERSDFQGPEVRRAIKSYYVDHETTLTVIEAIAAGTLSAEDKEKLLTKKSSDSAEESIFDKAISASIRLGDGGETEKRDNILLATLGDVYEEPCVGQRTLDEADIDELARRKSDVEDMLKPPLYDNKEARIDSAKRGIELAQVAARNETRDAGQLLFHNTFFGHDVDMNGSLRGRHQQEGSQDKVNVTTGNIAGHSSLTHWSEMYDPIGYKWATDSTEKADKGMALTLAVPLGEVIKQAPLARGMEYANVDAKAGRDVDASQIGHEGQKVVGEIGSGGMDSVGHATPNVDRVFWASKESVSEGASYDVPVGGTDIMQLDPERGIEMPVVYAIQSDNDRLRNYNETLRKVPPGDTELRQDMDTLSQREMLHKYGQALDDPNNGIGYGYPTRIDIQDLRLSTASPASQWISGGADIRLTGGEPGARSDYQAAAAEPYIRGIQKESIDRFAGSYVVPLRAVKMNFRSNTRDNSVINQYGTSLDEVVSRATYPR